MKTIRLQMLLMAFSCICMDIISAQPPYPPNDPFEVISNIDGVVDYQSNLYSSDLHFYMFGDGFYRREMHPINQFENNTNGFDTDLYHVKNKDDEPPTKTTRNTGATQNNNGTPISNPSIPMSPNIDPTLSWAFTDYADNFILLNFENRFQQLTSDGCVELFWNPGQLEVNATNAIVHNSWIYNEEPLGSSGYRWYYEDLIALQQRVLYVPTRAVVPAGTRVSVTAKIDDGCDGGAITRTFTTNTRRWPHDPNALEVINTDHLSVSESLEMAHGTTTQVLVYEVEFHNDGIAPVTTVVVEDVLDGNFKPSTALLRSSQHSGGLDIVGNTLIFTFDNINLPGLGEGVPYEETTSKFTFSVCLNDIAPNTCVENDVDIFFDNLAPINADNSICTTPDNAQFNNVCENPPSPAFGRSSEDLKNKLQILPNPVAEYLTWTFENPIAVNRIQVIGNDGKILKDEDASGDYGRLFVGDLTSGFYMINIVAADETFVQRFIKL